tara:strand:- start:25 stop:1008 length:984 start_codon:yes stop_codon:yes gene_type:complete
MTLFTQQIKKKPTMWNNDMTIEHFPNSSHTHSHAHQSGQEDDHSDKKHLKEVMYEHSHPPIGKGKKNTFMNNKLHTLDRKLVLTTNYRIINQNHIFILKMVTALLLIMISVYMCIQFKFLPKSIAAIILIILSVIFYIALIIVIIKNILLYRINKTNIYYPKENPMDIRRFFKKKCVKPTFLEGSGVPLESLIDILTELKDIAIKYEEYEKAKQFYAELVYILDNINENDMYGPFNSDKEIEAEIRKYSEDLENLKQLIKKNTKTKIDYLDKQKKKFKTSMAMYKKNMKKGNKDKDKLKAAYKELEQKYNFIVQRIDKLKKKDTADI